MQQIFDKEKSKEVKGLAILFLLAYHLFESAELVTSLGVNHAPFPLDKFLLVTGFGNVCVSVFVFLTAYGISVGIWRQENITIGIAYQQAGKRFFRLVGQFFALYLSVNLIWFMQFDYDKLYGMNKQGMFYLLTDAAGFSQFFETPTMNMTWWYMKVAYILIFLIPVLAFAVKKIGNPILIMAFLFPYAIPMDKDVQRYFFVAVFGVCAAHGEWVDKLLNLKMPYVVKWILGFGLLVLSVLVRQNYIVYQTYIAYVDAPIVLVIIYLACAVFGSIPGLNKVLAFIGTHSMNIYLVHTFFYMSLWRDFIYRFRYAGLIFLALLITTLLYSVVLEFVKNKVLLMIKGIL